MGSSGGCEAFQCDLAQGWIVPLMDGQPTMLNSINQGLIGISEFPIGQLRETGNEGQLSLECEIDWPGL